jgi:hypothetical protein
MTIDADLILRQARELQRLSLAPPRAQELARETSDLVEAALAAATGTEFENEPEEFLAVLSELRER